MERIEHQERIIQHNEGMVGCEDRLVDVVKPKMLLHSCCGPCSTIALERLSSIYNTYVFYYNPNITDEQEYYKRKNVLERFIIDFNEQLKTPDKVNYLEGSYEPEVFLDAVKGFEEEPEGGQRCRACFKLRLEKTAEMAALRDFEYFSTTLSVSPHKDFDLIQRLGTELGLRYKITFLARDFKKQSGYQRSVLMSKMYGLYRQKYCGCSFSLATK